MDVGKTETYMDAPLRSRHFLSSNEILGRHDTLQAYIEETSSLEAGAAAAASLDFRDEIPEPTGIVLAASRCSSRTCPVQGELK
jgi:hypothetical protein